MNILFDNLEKLIDAPNGIEKTRELILQLAVQGKLVEQDPNDEPASELLKKIKKEKEKLIAEGKIKKQKELPPIKEEEKPFEIPYNWRIERLGNVAHIITKGATPTTYGYKYETDGVPFVKVENIADGKLIFSNSLQYISEEAHSFQKRSQLQEHDVLFSIAGTIGETCIIRKEYLPANTNQALGIIRGTMTVFNPNYLKILLDSFVSNTIKNRARGGAMNNISLGDLSELITVIPPLTEQKRIVEKVNSLMALLDELEEKRERRNQKRIKLNNASLEKLLTSKNDEELKVNWKRIEENFSTLYSVPENVEKLKQTILQLAVQGKLVEQDPNDEPASELLKKIKKQKEKLIAEGKIKKQKGLPPIKEEEKPFELPKGWEWVRLPNVSFFQEGPGILAKDFRKQGTPLIRISGMHSGFVSLEGCNYLENEMVVKKWNHFRLSLGDIVLSSSASLGKVAKVGKDAVGSIPYTGLIRFQPYRCLNGGYLIQFFQTDEFLRQINKSKTGAAIKHFGPTHLKNMIIPIPPLKEQKRIVEKVNELMSLCNALEEKLTKKEEEGERFVKAVLSRVTNIENK